MNHGERTIQISEAILYKYITCDLDFVLLHMCKPCTFTDSLVIICYINRSVIQNVYISAECKYKAYIRRAR
jgi:hypothetical protein